MSVYRVGDGKAKGKQGKLMSKSYVFDAAYLASSPSILGQAQNSGYVRDEVEDERIRLDFIPEPTKGTLWMC